MPITTKNILIVQTQAPFGSSAIQESLDIVLAAGTFDQKVSLLLEEDACYQLLSDQQPALIDAKNTSKMLKALPIYGIDRLLVCSKSLAARNIHPQQDNSLQLVNLDEIKLLYQAADTVLRF